MNKRKFLTLTLSALLTSVPFVSCGDDDDEPDNPNGTDNPNELPQLRSIESYGIALFTFGYNSSGQLTQIKPGSMFADEIDQVGLAYKINSNGTIAAEQMTYEGETITMTYKYSASKALEETGDPTSAQQIKLPQFKSIFKNHRK